MIINKTVSANTKGTDYIVGDIHGCFTKLAEQLEAMIFDPTKDRLFCVGDLVDRGPESDQYEEWLQYPWLHTVMGNHEHMAIMYAEGTAPAPWYSGNGGDWNIEGSSVQKNAAAFRELPLTITLSTASGTIGIVHADVYGNDWDEFIERLKTVATEGHNNHVMECALWSRDRFYARTTDIISGVDAVVVGHTPHDAPSVLGNIHYIDNGAWHPSRKDWDFIIVKAEDLIL